MDNTQVPLNVAILKYQYDTEQMIMKDQKQFLIQFIEIYGERLNIQRIDNKLVCNQDKLNNIKFSCHANSCVFVFISSKYVYVSYLLRRFVLLNDLLV